jgi:hypothetical protein
MAQDWTIFIFDEDDEAIVDLQGFEDNFATLKGNFSGSSAPSSPSPVPGQLWFDTTDKLLKVRNAADNGWQGIMYGSANRKIWVYLHSAPDGWTYDSGVTDTTVAVEGGSTYTTAGTEQGNWTMSGMGSNANTHNHQWYLYQSLMGWSWTDAGAAIAMNVSVHAGGMIVSSKGDPYGISSSCWTKDDSHSHSSISYVSTFRPAAAVGILVYPKL